jgi:translation initiation factor 2 beta subunit (eIF-2beta)/eIF-5
VRQRNIFDKAKDKEDKGFKKCFTCGTTFRPDIRNVKRGWGMNCSKSCASNMKLTFSNVSELEKKVMLRDWKLENLGI